jgi:tetratricopeptide (TPR) repeat protein
MNIVGLRLLQSGKTKEAVAFLKLNVEAFPVSYTVYESYGEALMILGDKTQALENYKKSLHLNPGSRNGLKVLKEAGIDTDTLIKKIKLPDGYLKLLEGEYHSTNEPNGGVRVVKFMEEEGVLFGNDNGYRYKLIPMGDGKFINPDDGVSLIFDTKDKNAISLLLFGVLNLKKVGPLKESDKIKKIDLPIEDLKLLEGEYHAVKEKRKITFKLEDGTLYGTDNGYRYKIIPVGEGKFINPDDGASLVFDTKDKKAITLLLFGTINLKKVK